MPSIRYCALCSFLKQTQRPLSLALRDSKKGLEYLFRSREVWRRVRGGRTSDGKQWSFVLTAAENHKLDSTHLTGRLFIGEYYKLGVHISTESPENVTARAPKHDNAKSPWKYRRFRDIKERCVDLESPDAKDQRIPKSARATKGGKGVVNRPHERVESK